MLLYSHYYTMTAKPLSLISRTCVTISAMMTKFKDEIKKIKSMDRKKATDYVIMYYLPAAIGTVLALCLIVSTVTQAVRNRHLEPVIRAGVLKDIEMFCGTAVTDTLERAFADASGKEAPVKMTFTSPDETENMFSSIELSSYIAAGDVDFLLGDRLTAEFLSESEGLVSITDISDTELGKLSEDAGVSPLYYIYFTERERAGKAAYLLWFIQNDSDLSF